MGKQSKGFSFGFIIGGMIGGLFGLLYAPDKGINTRDRLSYQLNSYIDDITDLIEKLRRESQTVSAAKKEGDLVVEEAQKKAEDLIAEAEKLLKNIGGEKK